MDEIDEWKDGMKGVTVPVSPTMGLVQPLLLSCTAA